MVSPGFAIDIACFIVANGADGVPALASSPVAVVYTSPVCTLSFTYNLLPYTIKSVVAIAVHKLASVTVSVYVPLAAAVA